MDTTQNNSSAPAPPGGYRASGIQQVSLKGGPGGETFFSQRKFPPRRSHQKSSYSTDLLIVGAGPAGSRAAEAAAKAGARVILVEKKRRVGALPHCAEFVPRLLGLEVDIPERARVQAVEGMETWLAGGDPVFLPGPGWILDRQVFDHSLAVRAASAGAEIWVGAALKGREGGRWLVQRGGKLVEIKAGAVVAADGGSSRVASLAGWPGQDLMPGVQYQVPLAREMTRTQVFLEPRFLGGYAWLFPKGEVANLGLGCRVQARPWRLLEELRQEMLARGIIRNGVLGISAGAIPVGGMREELVRGEVVLCGDAAGLTHPITGAGIPQAVFSGREAGLAALALAEEVGKGEDAYCQELGLRYGRNLGRGEQGRKRWEKEWQGEDFKGLMAETWPGWAAGSANP